MDVGKIFAVATDLVAFAANAGGIPMTAPVGGKHDFVFIGGFYSCDVAAVMAGNDVTFGGYTIKSIGNSGADEQFINKPTPINHLFGLPGVGAGLLVLPFVGRIAKTGTIDLVVDSRIAAPSNLIITFLGFAWPSGKPLPAPYSS